MPDVVELIMDDHREVERLFNKLQEQPEKRSTVLPVLSSLLIAHSRAEEAEVYPVARQEARAADEISHGQGEHAHAEHLLAQLATEDPASRIFDRVLKDLIEAVTHHVEEEESTVLPSMSEQLGDGRLAELADAFAASRARHLGDAPGEATKEELQLQAQNMGVSGASDMSKEELEKQLKA